MGALLVSGLCSGAEFSADMVQKVFNKTYKGKLYVKGNKLRREATVSSRRTDIAIYRPDQKSIWYVMTESKTYMKVTDRIVIGGDDPTAVMRMKQIGVMKKLGKEKINGYVCNKVQWATKGPAKYVLTEWTSDKLIMPLRTEFKSPRGIAVIEYRNIKEGGVSNSVFELPKGYRRVKTPTAPKPGM
jgi:hypothetical protein